MYRTNLVASVVCLTFLSLGACTIEIQPEEQVAQGGIEAAPVASTGGGGFGQIIEIPIEPELGEGEGEETVPEGGVVETPNPAWTERVEMPAVALAAGAAHVCALAATGEVSCWGRNDVGQLGYGHTESIGDDEPAASHGDVDVGGPVVSIAAGEQHTCAILQKGSIRCWGYGGDLALGNGNGKDYTVGDDEVPGEMKDAIIYSNSPFVQLAAGDHHTCMLTQNGAVKCWGDSPEGALGYGYSTKTGGWLGNVPMGGAAHALVAGAEHTCAIVDSGAIRCWGEATSLGYGGGDNIGDDEQPSELGAISLGDAVVQLAAGDRHTCALTAAGAVRCWGLGEDGALGYGSTQNIQNAAAAGIVNLGGLAVQIAAGQSHTCALLLDGTARCWGEGSAGALGYGNTDDVGDNESPAVAGAIQLSEVATQLVAGGAFTCALLASGTVQCWGEGLDGRLGYGHPWTIGDDETPDTMKPILPFGQ
jgi:alpha-tubulin suppressor-like RCC1 family protein